VFGRFTVTALYERFAGFSAAEDDGVVVAGLNHKMGFRGTANCLLNFGEGGRKARRKRSVI